MQSKSADSECPDGPPTPAERIWQVVAMIPSGRVASYGQIARLAEMPRHARLVGRTLRELPAGTRLPWHRVVNAGLKISQRPGSGGHRLQRQRLEAEGIEFVGERIPRTFRWDAGLG
jgi:methylated-DNA-protein-cysteine methyltransferase-like protein